MYFKRVIDNIVYSCCYCFFLLVSKFHSDIQLFGILPAFLTRKRKYSHKLGSEDFQILLCRVFASLGYGLTLQHYGSCLFVCLTGPQRMSGTLTTSTRGQILFEICAFEVSRTDIWLLTVIFAFKLSSYHFEGQLTQFKSESSHDE